MIIYISTSIDSNNDSVGKYSCGDYKTYCDNLLYQTEEGE